VHSAFYQKFGEEIERILQTPQVFSPTNPNQLEPTQVRVAVWNIERGNRFEGILHHLHHHPILSQADILLLNEVDVGMLRTGNRHVGFDLAHALNQYCVYGVEYFETTKGIGDELNLVGENRTGFHGNAILSRFPLQNPRILRLPECFDHYHFHEKRYGGRIALYAEVSLGKQTLGVVTSHLEVRHTPKCRERQLQAILDWVDPLPHPLIIGGDWNTNTFGRGTPWRTLVGVARVLLTNPDRLKHQLRHPNQGLEPLFAHLPPRGFDLWDFNTDDPTVSIPMALVEDAGLVPEWVQSILKRRIQQHSGVLQMRLDWLAGRKIESVHPPATLLNLEFEGQPVSDHAPIVADITPLPTVLCP
jgi:endonuclease/exonuclease/phosphatase family metal-dependent hydrolase